MTSSARQLLLVALPALLGGVLGCASLPRASVSADSLVWEMQQLGLSKDHPFQLDPVAELFVRQRLGLYGSQEERLRRAVSLLNEAHGIHFQYAPHTTAPASVSLRSGQGDCMSYAALLTAVAQVVQVPTYFVYVREAPLYAEDDEGFVSSSHIAVGYGDGPNALVIDFAALLGGWKPAQYGAVDDRSAAALFFSNLAVESLRSGQPEQAEALLRRLIAHAPELPELHANLGVALLRQGRPEEALAVLEPALARFPEHSRLWANAVLAARRAGLSERAEQLATAAERHAGDEPTLRLLRAQDALAREDYAGAQRHLERALSVVPDSPLLQAWLVRTYMAAERRAEGGALFARFRRDFPKSPWVDELSQRFPSLGSLEASSLPPAPPRSPKVRRKG